MFDFDFGKLMVVAIVALAVIPPKDLPRVMRTVGQVVGKMRRMAAEFQGQFMDAMREADLESVRKELEALNEKAKIETSFDPATMIRDDVMKAVERPVDIGTSTVALNPPDAELPSQEAAAEIESGLDDVRRELEALNEKAKVEASFDPKAAAPAPPSPAPRETPAEAEAPAAKQSAAE
ncbi:MAG: twin-arginine translocase subunit TatB [Hyphomicrobiales bacterium]|nr:twin-arginine translocase subunit TatB [Hyphomicrobiales bacterium]MBV8443188.1 twin-arginine translocase subunit TatB [Hyphomicrobiales bacterium]